MINRSLVSKRFINLSLRSSTLLSKFLLLFILAKYYSEYDLGVFGLIFTTVNYLIYLFGFEYYTFSGRDIAGSNVRETKLNLVQDHFSFIFTSSLLIVPTVILISFFSFFENYIVFLGILLFSEFYSNEFYRILIYLNRQLLASGLMFIRSGLWGLIFITVVLFSEDISILFLYRLWAICSTITVLVSMFVFVSIGVSFLSLSLLTPKTFIINVKKSFFLLLSSLSVKLIQVLDRYVIALFASIEMVGVYTFFIGISNSLISLIDAGVTAFHYPKLVFYYRNQRWLEFHNERRKFVVSISGFIAFLVLAYSVSIYPMLTFLGKSSYFSNINVFFICLAAVGVISLSSIFHYDLYVKSHESKLALAGLFGLVIFLVLSLTISPWSPIGVPAGVLTAYLTIMITKIKFSKAV